MGNLLWLKNKRRLSLGILFILLAVLCVTIVLARPQQSSKLNIQTAKQQAAQSAESDEGKGNASTKPLTAGGQPVPPAWQAKARAKGYYCPSWNAKPGQAASDICLSLDK